MKNCENVSQIFASSYLLIKRTNFTRMLTQRHRQESIFNQSHVAYPIHQLSKTKIIHVISQKVILYIQH